MARTPIAASKESDVTSANEETLQFDDDNLRGEAQHAVSFYSNVDSGYLSPG